MESPYWNEYLETMPRKQLDAIHLKRLQGMIKYVYENIPMYRYLYDKVGLKPEDVRSLEDYYYKVPYIEKADIVRYQQNKPPFGDAIVPDSEEHTQLFYMTSGSTGKPMMEPGNTKDIQHLWTYGLWANGVRATDIFYYAFPFGTFMAFWSAYFDALLIGARVISSGGLDTKQRIQQMLDLKPTVLVATPTYALRLAAVAQEMGIDTREIGLKFIATAGEPGACVPSIRKALESAWEVKAIDIFGVSELWAGVSFQCPVHLNRLHFVETCGHAYVADENGNPVPDGTKGEYIITSYNASIQPMVKYRTHDYVEGHHIKCDCGRSWLSLYGGIIGRADNMMVIKGTNVYPLALQNILNEFEEFSPHFEIHASSGTGGDEVLIKVEPLENVPVEDYPKLKRMTEDKIKYVIGVRVEVEIVPPLSIPRYEIKGKRFFDHRSK
jgi:phenylacetate-CoA ligase